MNEDHTLVKPFIDAAVDTLGTMAMLDLECNTVGFVDRFEETLDYTATMGLCGEHEGLLVVSIGEPLLRKVVAAMLGEDEGDIDADLADGAGELANVIGGAAKGTLGATGYDFDLSIPAVIGGAKNMVTPQTATRGVRIECSCKGLPFVLGLWAEGLTEE